jgi:hypothetical protein
MLVEYGEVRMEWAEGNDLPALYRRQVERLDAARPRSCAS